MEERSEEAGEEIEDETVALNKQSILRAYRPEERGDRIKEAKGLKR